MKIKFPFMMLTALCGLLLSCKKDNYAPPSSKLTGHLMYKGDSIGVENYQVPFELYQYGFGKVGPIGSSFSQDGGYSALLFDGEYKLIVPNGQGPFLWNQLPSGAPDSISVSLKGSKTLDLEVLPYYMIRNAAINNNGTSVTATFKIEKVITDANAKDIERVNLYINKTQFVSGNGDEHNASAELSGGDITDPNNVTLSVSIPDMVPAQKYVFARIGLKIAGVEDMIFSPLTKINF
jgi:Domain of unknown function (DUF3823_C)/Protein of unknown function (DUF3823) N-terminal domain